MGDRLPEDLLDRCAAEGARLVARVALRELDEALRRVRKKKPDAIHRARVALRRVLGAVQAYRPNLRHARRHGHRCKRILELTSKARDGEAGLVILEKLTMDDDARAWVHERWKRAHETQEARARTQLATRLPSLVRTLRSDLRDCTIRVRHGATTRFDAVVHKALARAERRVVDRFAVLDAGGADSGMEHRARIAAKQLRYLLEPLESFGVMDPSALSALVCVQEALGQHRDLALVAAYLAAEASHAPEKLRGAILAAAATARDRATRPHEDVLTDAPRLPAQRDTALSPS